MRIDVSEESVTSNFRVETQESKKAGCSSGYLEFCTSCGIPYIYIYIYIYIERIMNLRVV
jgi:hypothetical protein